MATVELVDGRIVENVRLTDVQSVGEEGSRSAIAHIDGKTYPVYNSIVDGFNPVWHEQITWETYQMLKGTLDKGVIEGSVEESDKPEQSKAPHNRKIDLGPHSFDEDILKEVEDAAKRYWASINEPTKVSDVRIVERLENGDVKVAVMWSSERMQDGDEMVYLVSVKDGNIALALIEQP